MLCGKKTQKKEGIHACVQLTPFAVRQKHNSEEQLCTAGCGLVAKSCLTLSTLWTVAHQAPLSMGFSRQEHWSGVPFPPSGDLTHLGIELVSLVLHCRWILYC